MKNEIEIGLGIKWSDPDIKKITGETEALLNALDNCQYKKDIPIHWLIPPYPFLEQDIVGLNNLLLEIKARITTLNDIPVSIGYTGTDHPILSYQELEKEIAWSLSNPWNSGLKEVFGANPEIFIPTTTLLSDKRIFTLYQNSGFHYIGMNRVFPALFNKEINNLTPVIYIDMCALSSIKSLKKQIKTLLKEKHTYFLFLIDINCKISNSTLKTIWQNFLKTIEWLTKNYALKFCSVTQSQALPHSPFPEPFIETAALANTIMIRHQLLNTIRFKQKKETSDDDFKNILINLSAPFTQDHKTGRKSKRIIFPSLDRVSDCTMQGNTILAGSDFAANLNNGKLFNLESSHGNFLLIGQNMRSYMQISGKEHIFQNLSSFSVAGEHVRGLRESQKIEIPGNIHPGFQLTEYIFIDDFPYLLISSKIKYPSLDLKIIMEAIVPFEIPLFIINDSIDILALSDDTKQVHTLHAAISHYSIPANMVAIPHAGTNIIIGFPPEKSSNPGIFEFKIKQFKKQTLLSINIFGTYTPVEAKLYNRMTEIFSFYIGISPLLPEKPPYFPAKVLREIPDQVILDE